MFISCIFASLHFYLFQYFLKIILPFLRDFLISTVMASTVFMKLFLTHYVLVHLLCCVQVLFGLISQILMVSFLSFYCLVSSCIAIYPSLLPVVECGVTLFLPQFPSGRRCASIQSVNLDNSSSLRGFSSNRGLSLWSEDQESEPLCLSCMDRWALCTQSRPNNIQACQGVVEHVPWPNPNIFFLRLDEFHAVYVAYSLQSFLYFLIRIPCIKDLDYQYIASEDIQFGSFAILISTDSHKPLSMYHQCHNMSSSTS